VNQNHPQESRPGVRVSQYVSWRRKRPEDLSVPHLSYVHGAPPLYGFVVMAGRRTRTVTPGQLRDCRGLMLATPYQGPFSGL
jgi:hypothetical protein